MFPFCVTGFHPQMEINGFMTPYCAAEITDTAGLLHFSSAFPAGEQHNSYTTGRCSVPECRKTSGTIKGSVCRTQLKDSYERIKSKYFHAMLNSIN